MKRFNFLAVFALLCSGAFHVGSAQDQQTIDATGQAEKRPPRGRGPFPGSANPGHSAGLPIRLELRIPTRELRTDGTTPVDFIITNIGTEPIKLPSSVALFNSPFDALTLWVSSDGIKEQYLKDVGSGRLFKVEMVAISAELDGSSDDPKSFNVLAPNKSIRVQTSSPQLKAGTHSFTAHAELAHITNITEVIGTADSVTVRTTLSASSPNSR